MMSIGLAGRVAIVTGAAQGLGLATAEALAAAGARVLLADVQADKVQAAARHLLSEDGSCLGVGVDVTRAAEVEAMVRAALDAFGRVDILVNNAGGRAPSASRTSRRRARNCGIASSEQISKGSSCAAARSCPT
jgi:NAD(P)-dependent dehydrogenase (short-subunit alcohol dehydrogenase family)